MNDNIPTSKQRYKQKQNMRLKNRETMVEKNAIHSFPLKHKTMSICSKVCTEKFDNKSS